MAFAKWKWAGVGLALLLGGAVLAITQNFGCATSRTRPGGPGPLARVPPPLPATRPAEPDLKIAFIGDSGAGPAFARVLELVAAEKATAVVHGGDAVYAGETPEQFWAVVDRVLGHDYPYFLAQGNHDVSQWAGFVPHAADHFQAGNVKADLADPRFHFVYRGLSAVFLPSAVKDDDPSYIVERFSSDEHIWKLCVWHHNQENLQVGRKQNEKGWGVYESCRQMGALVLTAHEHSYHRTKTLMDMETQRIDPICPDRDRVCVRPGAVPVFVSGLGGQTIRPQHRCLPADYPYGCNGEWAFIYTRTQGATFGALFLAFGVEGNPRKGIGYFKNVNGVVVDKFEIWAP